MKLRSPYILTLYVYPAIALERATRGRELFIFSRRNLAKRHFTSNRVCIIRRVFQNAYVRIQLVRAIRHEYDTFLSFSKYIINTCIIIRMSTHSL